MTEVAKCVSWLGAGRQSGAPQHPRGWQCSDARWGKLTLGEMDLRFLLLTRTMHLGLRHLAMAPIILYAPHAIVCGTSHFHTCVNWQLCFLYLILVWMGLIMWGVPYYGHLVNTLWTPKAGFKLSYLGCWCGPGRHVGCRQGQRDLEWTHLIVHVSNNILGEVSDGRNKSTRG